MRAPVLCPHCDARLSLVAAPAENEAIVCHADDQWASLPIHWLITFVEGVQRASGVGLAP